VERADATEVPAGELLPEIESTLPLTQQNLRDDRRDAVLVAVVERFSATPR
jgi:hypothetical protein